MASHISGFRKALRPGVHQPVGFIGELFVAGGPGHASHSAEPLTEDDRRSFPAPSIQVFAGRGQTGLSAKSVDEVVFRQCEIEIAGGVVLVGEAAGQEADAGTVEGFEAQERCRLLGQHGRGGQRECG